jgi:hypothetical protein
LRRRLHAELHRLLPARFQFLENLRARFAQTLFVLTGARVRSRNISARSFQGTLSTGASLCQNGGERLVNKYGINEIKDCQKDRSRDGSEQ